MLIMQDSQPAAVQLQQLSGTFWVNYVLMIHWSRCTRALAITTVAVQEKK